MEPGDRIELAAYGGEQIIRRVVAVRSATVEVCAENDYEASRRGDKRKVVGFPIVDVLKVEGAFASHDRG